MSFGKAIDSANVIIPPENHELEPVIPIYLRSLLFP